MTAKAGDVQRTLRVDLHVARDLTAALDYVARTYDPAQRYVSATEKAFKTARESRDLAALKRAVDRLEPLTPRLADGTLDYYRAGCTDFGSRRMSDGDPMTWGNPLKGEKSFTMDFGSRNELGVYGACSYRATLECQYRRGKSMTRRTSATSTTCSAHTGS